MTDSLPIQELPYEQAFAELEAIVAALESNQQTLDESMRLFERGQALAQHCNSLLDQADLKIQQISNAGLASFDLPE